MTGLIICNEGIYKNIFSLAMNLDIIACSKITIMSMYFNLWFKNPSRNLETYIDKYWVVKVSPGALGLEGV